MQSLLIGIKRLVFRGDDSSSGRADQEYRAKRPGALLRGGYSCVYCSYTSVPAGQDPVATNNQVHHANDDHADNSDENLVCACKLCHPYQHVGEAALSSAPVPGEGLRKSTSLAYVPEINAADLNCLQRAIGVALQNESEVEMAKRIHDALTSRVRPTKEAYGVYSTADFAAGMANLSDKEYVHRGAAVQHLRLIFSPVYLRQIGKDFLRDYQSLGIESWKAVEDSVKKRLKNH